MFSATFNDRVLDVLEEGFDLAVRIGPLPDSSRLLARRLGMQRMGICAAPEYLARNGRPASLRELEKHVGVAYVNRSRPVPWRLHGEDGSIIESHLSSRLGFDDLQSIADAAISGAGLAWLPGWMIAPEISAGRSALVMDAKQVAGTEIHAVLPRMPHLPLKVRVTLDALVSEIPKRLGYGLDVRAEQGERAGPNRA